MQFRRATQRAAHPNRIAAPEQFRREILPGLSGVKLPEIMAACGVSKTTVSGIRSGRSTPSARHWPALAKLAGLDTSAQDS